MDSPRRSIRNVDDLWDTTLPTGANISRIISGEAYLLSQTQHQEQGLDLHISEIEHPTITEPPTFLSKDLPSIDELWDPEIPFAINLHRITQGSTAHLPPKQQEVISSIHEGLREGRRKLDHQDVRRIELEFEEIVRALRRPASDSLQGTLYTLQQQVETIFLKGPWRAITMLTILFSAAESGVTSVRTPCMDLSGPLSWKSSRMAAILVGIIACPSERLCKVAKSSKGLDDGRSYEFLHDPFHSTPSASLRAAFQSAESLARGEKKISSVLVVSLVDVHYLELWRHRQDKH
jgi:hypothetical protein